jgi:predicted AAA+ superfamily ATPase
LELTESLKTLLKETAQTLKGYERRRFMAKTVAERGTGGLATGVVLIQTRFAHAGYAQQGFY